jgi:phenylalanyl-tRNA synthetase alpha chain
MPKTSKKETLKEEMQKKESREITEIIESLSPNERKILLFLEEKEISEIIKKSELDETSVLRSLEFLSNKDIINLKIESKKFIELGVNGILYKQKGLPERRLMNLISEEKEISLQEAIKKSELSENEFQASLGALKKKALATLEKGIIKFAGSKEEISKKTLEEQFLEILPIGLESLKPEQKYAFENLKNRKDIIEITSKNEINFKITDLGKTIAKSAESIKSEDMLEALTPEIISNESWKNKKFRRYDIKSPVPRISGGKRHFVNQGMDYARKVWTEMGFKEMPGNLAQTGFWNFDALFTAQDHPVREIQDTFYIKDIKGILPKDKKNIQIVSDVKKSHETGVSGSKGWQYKWSEDEAKRVILRTHTTCLSAQTLASLRNLKSEDKRGKFFAVGKCFRNETVDWKHGFEFNQTEGIVVDRNANFKHLLGYLKSFFNKMGFENVKFIPSYFPYTEPSVEIWGYLKEKKEWIEIGGSGIFRPEVVVPLLGEYIPVLAWGPGFDRTLMDYYKISDLRDFYNNDLNKLRKTKFWVK